MMHIINEHIHLPVDQYLKLFLIATTGTGTGPKFASTNINLSFVELNHTLAIAQSKAWLSTFSG